MNKKVNPNLSEDKLQLLGREAVEALLTDDNEGPHVSLYMPTRPEALSFQKDPIRLKNLLQSTAKDLAERDLSPQQVDELLAPARALLDNDEFWKSGGHGVAVLLAPGATHVHRLPLAVEEVAMVGDRFHVKPLLRLVGASDRFWLLALSQQHVRLFEATRYTMREIDSLDLPTSVQDVVGYDYEDRSLQFHTGAGREGGGQRHAMFHGQGSGSDDAKEELVEFLRSVDQGIRTLLQGRTEPLVVAAVDYEIAMYRDVSKYDHVLDKGIEGNPEHVDTEELHRAAVEIVRPLLTESRRQAADLYGQLVGTGKASRQLEEIVPAAFDGRVATLFVAPEEFRWGAYDEATRDLRRDGERQRDNNDLLELAAAKSLLQGADVHAVSVDEVPGDGVIAAIFRY
jgi:hypothetical protein